MTWYKKSQEYNYEGELTTLLRKMALLDQELTGKNWHMVTQQAWHYKDKFKDPEYVWSFANGFGDVYYLSDGGYSRVGVSDDTYELFLTYNSLDKPRENWDKTESLRREIEADLKALSDKYEEEDSEKRELREQIEKW